MSKLFTANKVYATLIGVSAFFLALQGYWVMSLTSKNVAYFEELVANDHLLGIQLEAARVAREKMHEEENRLAAGEAEILNQLQESIKIWREYVAERK